MMVADGREIRRSWIAAEPTLELPPRIRIDLGSVFADCERDRPGMGTFNPISIAAAAVRNPILK